MRTTHLGQMKRLSHSWEWTRTWHCARSRFWNFKHFAAKAAYAWQKFKMGHSFRKDCSQVSRRLFRPILTQMAYALFFGRRASRPTPCAHPRRNGPYSQLRLRRSFGQSRYAESVKRPSSSLSLGKRKWKQSIDWNIEKVFAINSSKKLRKKSAVILSRFEKKKEIPN